MSGVHYHLRPSDPRHIEAVTFNLDRAPTPGAAVRIRLTKAGSTSYPCIAEGPRINCLTVWPQATVATADELTVIVD